MSIYQLRHSNGTDEAGATLKWISSTSTWEDHGTGAPAILKKNGVGSTTFVTGVVAGDIITGFVGAAQRGQFTHPSSGIDTLGTQLAEQQWITGNWVNIQEPSGTVTEEIVLNNDSSTTIKKVHCNFW